MAGDDDLEFIATIRDAYGDLMAFQKGSVHKVGYAMAEWALHYAGTSFTIRAAPYIEQRTEEENIEALK